MNNKLIALHFYRLTNPNELTPEQFKKLENEIRQPASKTISDEYADFKLWYNGYPSRQYFFKDFLVSRLQGKNISKILEVGCGRTAILSKLLASEGYDLTCIDPELELSKNFANLKIIKDVFNYQTFNVTYFDLVIAQEPCDATEHIIRSCINQNVPFIISLCAAPHKLISGEIPGDIYKWYIYLKDISPENIKLEAFCISPFVSIIISSSDFSLKL